ncbi:ABC transporter permease [Aquimarina gracilis]
MINSIGLGIGIASFLALALYVYNDLTYNQFHENYSNIYRVREGESVQTKGLLLPKMLEEIPEIENGTRIFDWEGARLKYQNIAFYENINYVDTDFFTIFSFPFIEGSNNNAIQNKYDVVISTQFAEKYFGNETAFGKKLQVNFGDIFLTVKGVVDIPSNSSIKFNIVASYKTGEEILPMMKEVHDWYNTFSTTYIQLADGVKPNEIQSKLQNIVRENFLPVGENTTNLNLQSFKEYHVTQESNPKLITILSIIALGILGIAIVNFVNLTITNSLSRIREIGIKKVHGASPRDLFIQISTESFIVGLAAIVFGSTLVFLFLPNFNELFNTKLHFNPLQSKFLIFVLMFIWVVIGSLAGLIPFLFWVRVKLVNSLHGNLFSINKNSFSRYSLIVLQFVIAIVLISGTFLIRKQIDFMMNKDPKFDNENVIVIQTDNWQFENLKSASQKLKLISEELKSSAQVESVSFSQSIPGTYHENYNTFFPQTKAQVDRLGLRKAYVGRNYFKTFGIQMLSGSGFDSNTKTLQESLILNKTAMNELGFKVANGQLINESSATGQAYRLIGAVEDFSYQGLQREIQPLAHIFVERENVADWNYLSIKTKPGSSLQVIDFLEEKWKTNMKESSLTYFFADEKLNEHYNEYVKINTMIGWFSIVAILLSSMGLFAISSYTMVRRTKEIGIRKVNGAGILQIMSMLNKDFLRWVIIAFLIACPIAYYGLDKWLQSFAYKTTLSWWIFALAGFMSITIAFITVSWQSLKAARVNPALVMRDE